MYHSDPENSASYPVTFSGSVTHSNTPQTGPIYVVAVKPSNSWDTGRSDVIASPGAFAVEGVPNLADYWVKAWVDEDADGLFDPDREASGAWTNNPFLLSNSVWGIDIALADVDADGDGMPATAISTFRRTRSCSSAKTAPPPL